MIGGVIANTLNAAFSQTETFDGNGRMESVSASSGRLAIVSFLTVFLIFTLLLFFGKYLWNNVLVVLVPAIKPAKSVWQILGLAVLISLMSPGCCTL
jgi:hypothetical protein